MRLVRILLLLAFVGCLTGCYYSHPASTDGWNNPEGRVDSASFSASHHYAHNFNFKVTADSLVLAENQPGTISEFGLNDSCTLYRRDKIVVADIIKIPSNQADSIWIKVARDQTTQGWINEQMLLESAIPNDPISSFIHYFSDTRLLVCVSILGLALMVILIRIIRRRKVRIVHFNDIHSFYPTLQCLSISGAAVLYGSMQTFVPQTWVEFYFHPTLNPFGLPLILSLFIMAVWLNVITALAVVDDVRRRLPFNEAFTYLSTLLAVCSVLYLGFTLTVGLYIGYPLFVAYVWFALRRYFSRYNYPYRCGRCGREMAHLGTCPHCGAHNK